MARKKIQQKERTGGLPLWLGTFGDLMSLLLTFFILLLSMATFDKERVELAMGSLRGALSILENGSQTEITTPNPIQATPIKAQKPIEETKNVFSSLVSEYNEMTKVSDGPSVELEDSIDGFVIHVPSDLLFNTGSAEISGNKGRMFLKRLAMELNNSKNILMLKIVGNTDNTPFRSTSIDNWQLSINRALSVADELSSFGVPISIMQTGGESDFNPIASNDNPLGRAKNRRVDIYFRDDNTSGMEANAANDLLKRFNKEDHRAK